MPQIVRDECLWLPYWIHCFLRVDYDIWLYRIYFMSFWHILSFRENLTICWKLNNFDQYSFFINCSILAYNLYFHDVDHMRGSCRWFYAWLPDFLSRSSARLTCDGRSRRFRQDFSLQVVPLVMANRSDPNRRMEPWCRRSRCLSPSPRECGVHEMILSLIILSIWIVSWIVIRSTFVVNEIGYLWHISYFVPNL